MLAVNNVKKSFGEHEVISGFSYKFEYGNIYCILGKSGCGKTTLLRIIAGLSEPDSGSVTLDDHTIIKPTWEITMMHQSYNNFPFLSALENVALPQKLGREKPDWDKCKEFLDTVGIPYDKYPHELSGGMNQRLALARMLNTKHKVCLMDEPLSALDSITRAKMQKFLIDFNKKQGNTMIVITHDADEAKVLAKPEHIIKL